MGLTLTVTDHWDDGKKIHALGLVAATGNYAAGGIALNLAAMPIKSDSKPEYTSFVDASGYTYRYVPGTNRTNGKVMILQNGAINSPMAELGAGALPGTITSLKFYGIFPKFK